MRHPKPFYWKARKAWYVEINGKQIKLSADEQEAYKKYHEVMLRKSPTTERSPLFLVIEQFLDHVKETLSPKTHTRYSESLNLFLKWMQKNYPSIVVEELKPFHVAKFREKVRTKNGNRYSDNSFHGMIRALKRCFSWSKKQGLIPVNPVEDAEVPPASPREVLITQEQWNLVMEHAKGEEFIDLLMMMRETGCRPFEIRTAEASHFDHEGRRLIFERRNSKGKKYNRVVYLSETAFQLTSKWLLRYPNGAIFRNERGRPWTQSAVNCRLVRLKKHVGFKLMPYAIRHTFATEALKNDVDSLVVAQLMGHRDLTMVARVYGHLGTADQFLHDKLAQATKPKPQIEPT